MNLNNLHLSSWKCICQMLPTAGGNLAEELSVEGGRHYVIEALDIQ